MIITLDRTLRMYTLSDLTVCQNDYSTAERFGVVYFDNKRLLYIGTTDSKAVYEAKWIGVDICLCRRTRSVLTDTARVVSVNWEEGT